MRDGKWKLTTLCDVERGGPANWRAERRELAGEGEKRDGWRTRSEKDTVQVKARISRVV